MRGDAHAPAETFRDHLTDLVQDINQLEIDIADLTNDEKLDRVENFHGNQIVYLGWDYHLMFCAPFAFPLPPDMPFGALIEEVIPGAYSQHPEFPNVDWDAAVWHLNGEPFTPDLESSLIAQGIDHKSILRFATPGLDGYKGSGT